MPRGENKTVLELIYPLDIAVMTQIYHRFDYTNLSAVKGIRIMI